MSFIHQIPIFFLFPSENPFIGFITAASICFN